MIIRYVTIILTATVLAMTAAVGVSAVEPKAAEAKKAGVAVESCTGGTINLSADEKRMLDLHNEIRADWNLPEFCVHPALTKAARAHSREMLDKDYFSHNSYNGQDFSVRLKRFGYEWRAAGENIAWGSGSYATPEQRFDAWMKSPGHKANILNGNFREIGIGAQTGTYKQYNGAAMWTADFGTRR